MHIDLNQAGLKMVGLDNQTDNNRRNNSILKHTCKAKRTVIKAILTKCHRYERIQIM